MERYERCISKIGDDIYVDRLQTVSANVNDAHRSETNGCTGETAGIAWIPDGASVTGYISSCNKFQQTKKIKKKEKIARGISSTL